MTPSARHLDVGGIDTFTYDEGSGDVPVVCVHGNPDSADLWLALVGRSDRLGRVLAPDLPCFGRSARPPTTTFDAGLGAYADWFEAYLDAAGVDRYRLVVHDWGSVALAGALRAPERVDRLVVLDIVPLSSTYRWHWLARYVWRPPVVGELSMLGLNRAVVDLITRAQRPGFRSMDHEWLDRVGRDLDRGMKDAVLALYRSADPDVLGAAGAASDRLTCPSLVLWGEQDPYIHVDEAARVAASLGGPSEVRTYRAGHWLLVDRPEVADDITDWLAPAT